MIHTTTTPSGVEIVFEDGDDGKRRGYKVDTEVFPSVTTILGCIDRSGPLMHWAVQETLAGRDYKETRDTAATRGTSVHDALEALARDGTPPDLGLFPEEDRGYVSGLCAWWLEHDPLVVMVEQVVASKFPVRYAGKLDLVAEIDGISMLVDLKTSRSVYPESHFQVEAYRLAVGECGWPMPAVGMILRVGEDGSYEFVRSRATPEDFLVVATLYESLKRVRRKPKVEKAAA